jgi:hypothetical protein
MDCKEMIKKYQKEKEMQKLIIDNTEKDGMIILNIPTVQNMLNFYGTDRETIEIIDCYVEHYKEEIR